MAGSVLIVAGPETTSMYAEYFAWRGVEVREAGTGALAVHALSMALPDGVVISERLPDCSGHDLIRALRRSHHTFDLCVILLASNTFTPEAHDTEKHGCDLVLTVPVLPDELVAALQQVMDHRESHQARPFESWLFVRDGESVWMVRTAPLELTVAGPRDRRAAFHFDAADDLRGFQSHYQQRLLQTGFVLQMSGADRRSGRERRHERRAGQDRRLLQ